MSIFAICAIGDSGGVYAGEDDPNSATSGTPTAAAACMSPESLLTTAQAPAMRRSASSSEVLPTRFVPAMPAAAGSSFFEPSSTTGVRTAAATGATTMILTNGAGGIRESWKPGQPVLISDHINLTADSPLEGATFVDLTDLYSSRLREVARGIDPSLDEGVYCQFRGPHYETPAEVQMAKTIGGHIVGMSTALEAIAARQAGMEILGFSLITNLAAGIQQTPLSHAEVLEAGRDAEPVISDLLARVIGAL